MASNIPVSSPVEPPWIKEERQTKEHLGEEESNKR